MVHAHVDISCIRYVNTAIQMRLDTKKLPASTKNLQEASERGSKLLLRNVLYVVGFLAFLFFWARTNTFNSLAPQLVQGLKETFSTKFLSLKTAVRNRTSGVRRTIVKIWQRLLLRPLAASAEATDADLQLRPPVTVTERKSIWRRFFLFGFFNAKRSNDAKVESESKTMSSDAEGKSKPTSVAGYTKVESEPKTVVRGITCLFTNAAIALTSPPSNSIGIFRALVERIKKKRDRNDKRTSKVNDLISFPSKVFRRLAGRFKKKRGGSNESNSQVDKDGPSS